MNCRYSGIHVQTAPFSLSHLEMLTHTNTHIHTGAETLPPSLCPPWSPSHLTLPYSAEWLRHHVSCGWVWSEDPGLRGPISHDNLWIQHVDTASTSNKETQWSGFVWFNFMKNLDFVTGSFPDTFYFERNSCRESITHPNTEICLD